ncbi:Ubiquinone biosynthesis protein [Blastocladiella emersonii ATCC 22665]|nr:Ubiquinone biosynthesis protein [Blastocladiella emersonii ATCC 22665]
MNAPKLYGSHIPTSALEKAFLTVACGLKALHDPTRGDMVAAVGETLGTPALRQIRRGMLNDRTGRRILRDRPTITNATLESLSSLAPATFGGAYYHGFMAVHGYDPDGRTPVHFVDDAELAYVMLRYRQVHDFWHTLTGLPPTVEGELALKVLEYVQTGLPMTALAALTAGPLKLAPAERERLVKTYVPWALSTGMQARPLMNVYYEELVGEDLDAVRRELRIEPAPVVE